MQERPVSLIVFGILNIGLALLKLLTPVFAELVKQLKLPKNATMTMMESDPTMAAWTHANVILSVVFGVALLAFGIGLLLSKNWARVGSIVYAAIDIVLVLVGSAIGWRFATQAVRQAPGMPAGIGEAAAVIGMGIGLVFSLAYPVLLLIFMTRPNVVQACQPAQGPPAAAT